VSRSDRYSEIGSGGRNIEDTGVLLRNASGGDDQIYVHNVVTSMSMYM